jgi:hypothetical protein
MDGAAATVLARDEVEAESADGGNAPPDNLLLSRQDEGARPKCKRPSFKELIQHELDDVYILLDYLSGRGDRIGSIELDHKDKKGHNLNLIDAVCRIKWPSPQEQERSEQAAILLKARDKLNQIAMPATGLTIAYTLLVAPDPGSSFRRRFALAWRTTVSFMKRPISPIKSVGQRSSERDDGAAPNGYPHFFARKAYPHLVDSAHRCRRWIDWLPRVMIIALIATSVLSWYVGYGKFILLRIEQLDAQRAEIAAALDLVEKPRPAPASPGNPARGTPSEAWLQDEEHLDQRCQSAKQPDVSLALSRACMAADQLKRKRSAADEALTEWSAYALWLPRSAEMVAILWGGPVPKHMGYQLTAPEREEQWAANLLAILGNYVLPMMYGFLGAAVAAMMNLKQKIRSYRLSPRDRRMNHVQLALGIITGACIGLFLTASSAGSGSAPLSGSSIPLSASALSFLAGFGVEGVFKMLENIMITVFGGQPNPPASHARR